MAESGLSIGLPELIEEVGFFLSYGRSGHSAAQLAEIMGIIQSGVRRVYYPPAVDQSTIGYEWSWLKPTTTLSVVSGTTDYDLPDDLGRVIGNFHYPAEEYRASAVPVPLGQLLEQRATSAITGPPRYFATRHKTTTGAAGQRLEVLFWPEPDEAWTMTYVYEAYNGALSTSYPYPLGGMKMAELYIESCLAVAESRLNDEIGQHTEQYKALLVDAVARDRKQDTRFFGAMGDAEDDPGSQWRRGHVGGTYDITYDGETI